MMNRFLLSFLLCVITLGYGQPFAQASPASLTLTPRVEVMPPVVNFTPDVRAWLQTHAEIRVGVWGISQPPVSVGIERGQLAGIDADYLSLLESSLNVHFTLVHYQDSKSALAALSRGEITLLAIWNRGMSANQPVRASLPWLLDRPVLVSRQQPNADHENAVDAPDTLLRDLLDDSARLSGRNPLETGEGGHQDYYHAVNAVALGNEEARWMNRATAHYLTRDRQVEHIWLHPHPTQGDLNLSFGVSTESPHLLRAIDAVLQNLPLVSRLRIAHNWGLGNDHVIDRTDLHLNTLESRWLKRHDPFTVLLDSRRSPLTFVDAKGQPAGLAVDVLKWISQRYGLTFSWQIADSDRQMADLLVRYPNALVASELTVPGESESAQSTLTSSAPWLISPAVLLMNRASPRPVSLHDLNGEKIAIERHNPLIPWLETWFPTLQLVQTDTSDMAVKLLEVGEVHAAISSQFSAQYYLKHNDEHQLYQALALPARPLNVGFAARGDNPCAISIINKALRATSPETLLKLAYSWRTLPTPIEEQHFWSTPFWSVALPLIGLLLVLVLGGLWIGRLRQALRNMLAHLRRNQMLIEQLQQARDENQRMLQAHNAFMKSMSHEVRTPINAVIGLLELELRQQTLSGMHNSNLQTAYESACELMSLTGDVFDIFQAETQDTPGMARMVNLPSLVHSTVALYRQQAEEKSLRISVVNDLKEAHCETDSLLIIRVLSSLLRNAVRHTAQGEIEVALYQGDKDASGNLPLVIEVCDEGDGLPDNFDPLIDAGNNEGVLSLQGTGLSLLACQTMLEQAGGELIIESEADSGTTVSLHLLVRPAPPQDEEVPPMAGLNILVVDDYPPALQILRQQLKAMGHQVTTAAHGLEGLYCWQNKADFALIITDCTMPEMDGFEMTRRIRALEQQRGASPLPILGLTAMSGAEVTQDCLNAGMNQCLTKPLSSNALQHLIAHYTKAKHCLPA